MSNGVTAVLDAAHIGGVVQSHPPVLVVGWQPTRRRQQANSCNLDTVKKIAAVIPARAYVDGQQV